MIFFTLTTSFFYLATLLTSFALIAPATSTLSVHFLMAYFVFDCVSRFFNFVTVSFASPTFR
jgi:hypothetical protein